MTTRHTTVLQLLRSHNPPDARFVAFTLPSRVGGRLYYPDGRVEKVTQ